MAEVMMRSHKFAEAGKKLTFPGYVSAKFDGVPGGYSKSQLITRQNKPLAGAQWIHEIIAPYIPDGWQLWGEHWNPDMDFQEISGRCRKDEPWKEAKVMFFNYFDMFNPSLTFEQRQRRMENWMEDLPTLFNGDTVGLVMQNKVNSLEEALLAKETIRRDWKATGITAKFEGCMYHTASGLYTINRSWASLKMVDKITYDLQLHGVEEASSKTGKLLGMVGTLVFKDGQGRLLNVGPGKLKHHERRDMWDNYEKYHGRIGTISAKGSTYEALREPTFQNWHEDKENADVI